MSVVCPSELGCEAGVASADVLLLWACVCALARSAVCCVSENGFCVLCSAWGEERSVDPARVWSRARVCDVCACEIRVRV